MRDWSAWGWDFWTMSWVAWIVWFIIIEALALYFRPGQALTAHVRPLFHVFPILWFIGFGLWLWLGVHFLLPSLERQFWRL